MLLNRRSEYAILGLIYLARQASERDDLQYIDVREVADAAGVPSNLLRVLFHKLAKDGLLRSQRGVRGGFVLGRAPETINLIQIIESVQGPIIPFSCVSTEEDPDDCDRFAACELYGVLRRVRDRVIEELNRNTLADMVACKNENEDEVAVNRRTFAA